MASHGFLCRIPAQLLPWPSVFPQLQPQPVSPNVTGSILLCSILGTVTRALSFTHPTDHVTLAHPTAHLPYPCTWTCLVPVLLDLPCSHSHGSALFRLSWTCLVPTLLARGPVPALSLIRDQTEPITCFFSVQTSHFKLSHVFPTWLCHEDYDLWQREAARVLRVLAPSGTAGSRCLELRLLPQPKPIGYEFLGPFGSPRASPRTPGEQDWTQGAALMAVGITCSGSKMLHWCGAKRGTQGEDDGT